MKQRFRAVTEYGRGNAWSNRRVRLLKLQCARIWDKTRFVDDSKVLELLSLPLQEEVVAITRAKQIERAHLLRDIPGMRPVALYLATRLKLEIFCAGQQVYHFGEPTVGFFLVLEGAVLVTVPHGDPHGVHVGDESKAGGEKAG